ncbi:MAG: FAD binding domain-containing protein [Deltaproteobacteria bacterium]|nr:FAD binding domain-containing protein [Deltaproteobacteria bacterium]
MVQQFLRPATPAEAVQMRKDTGGAYLAGGTQVNWNGPPDVPALVSLAALPLGFVRDDGSVLEIGPNVTLQELVDHEALAAAGLSELGRAVAQIGNRSIRCLATVGGTIGANKPYSDLIPVLIALAGTVSLATLAGEESMTVEDYVGAPPPEALIVALRVPRPDSATAVSVQRLTRSVNDFPVVNAALALRVVAGALAEPRLAVAGVAPTVVRLSEPEALLSGAAIDKDWSGLLGRFAAAVTAQVTPEGDGRGSASYRAELAGTLARRALQACIEEKGG